jgi:hypothetical protein
VIQMYECIGVFGGGFPLFKGLSHNSSLLSILDLWLMLIFGLHGVYSGFVVLS